MNAKEILQKFVPQINLVIEKELKNQFPGLDRDSEFISGLIENIMSICSGGKRLRGAFVYHAYKMYGGKNIEEIMKVAAFVEIIHSHILMADDIIDEDDSRRGVKTIHNIYTDVHKSKYNRKDPRHFGDSIGICGSLITGYAAQNIIFGTKFDHETKMKAIDAYYRSLILTGYGEALDVLAEVQDKVTEEEAMEINFLKTSTYTYESPLHLGAMLANAPEDQIQALSKYAVPGGIAFQIQDDILGIFGESETTGKSTDSDIREGKRNILTIKAYELSNEEERILFDSILGKRDATTEEINEARRIIRESGALEYSKNLANKYLQEALEALKEIKPVAEGKEFLEGIAEYMIKRQV